MKKERKATVGAAVLFSLLMAAQAVFASTGIDDDRACTIKVETEAAGEEITEDINLVEEIPVKFYKVAEISEIGEFTSLEAYADCGIERSEETNWQDVTDAVYGKIKGVDLKEENVEIPEEDKIAADYTGTIRKGVFEPLTVEKGLYLVAVDDFTSDTYQYTANPYLISVPDNLYYHQDAGDDAEDAWVYDVTVGLKLEREDRLGRLVIHKDLTGFQKLLGPTTFVFQVEATKADPITEEEKVVYSTVAALTFTGDGSQETMLEDIPAGAVVKVKEIYSGASYKASGETEQILKMEASEGQEIPEITVNFTNAYDDELHPGHGVSNHFENNENGGWDWVNPTADAE